jgi:hypothetical protein
MWTSGDADAIARYEALPAPLRLQKYLGLVNPEPTGWVSVRFPRFSGDFQTGFAVVSLEGGSLSGSEQEVSGRAA